MKKSLLEIMGRSTLVILILIVMLFAPLALFAEMSVHSTVATWGTTNGVTNIASDAVTSNQITDASINRSDLSADCVNGTKIADDAVDSEHIAAGSVDQEHYADNMTFSGNSADLVVYAWTNTLSSGTHTQTFGVTFGATPLAVVVQWAEDPGSSVTGKVYAAQANWTTTNCVVTGEADKLYTGIAVGAK